MATQDNTLNNNPAWGTTPSSSTIQTGFTGTSRLGGASERIRQAAMSDVLSAGAGSADAPYAEGLRQLEAQKATAITQKQLAGLGAIQSIGDLHDQIYENQRQQRVAQAAQGFVGGGQALRQEKSFENKVGASENTIQRNLLNAVRQGNMTIDQLTNDELRTLQGTGAMADELSKEVMRRREAGDTSLYDVTAAQGASVGQAIKSLFGGSSTNYGSATLNRDVMKNSAYFKSLASELGLDMNNKQVMDRLADHLNEMARPSRTTGNLWTTGGIFNQQVDYGANSAGQSTHGSVWNTTPNQQVTMPGERYNPVPIGDQSYQWGTNPTPTGVAADGTTYADLIRR